MKKITKLKELALILICIILTIIIFKYLNILNILFLFLKILIPVFIGFIYAWLVNPFITKLSKKYKRNFICIVLFLFIIIIIGLFFYSLIPIIYKEIDELVDDLPTYLSILNKKTAKFNVIMNLEKTTTYLLDNIPVYLLSGIKSIFKYLGVLIMGLIIGLYMTMDYDKIICQIDSIIPSKIKNKYQDLTNKISIEVRKCVNGTLLIAFLVFVGDTICFYFLKLDTPLLLGILCGLTDLIPYVGPYIGGAIAVLVGFTKNKMLGVITLICCFIVQAIENYILQPFVMSKSIKLSPVIIMIGLLLFGKLLGIFGMILAMPILAMLKVIINYFNNSFSNCD